MESLPPNPIPAKPRAGLRAERDVESTPAVIAALMVALAGANAETRVLEAACGQGEFLDALAELSPAPAAVVAYGANRAAVFAARDRHPDFTIERRDFLRTPREPAFDLAIGRPPYHSWSDIPETTRHILTTRPFWRTKANGDWDLLYASLIWQVEKLAPGGHLLALTPSTWLTASGAAELRRYLAGAGAVEAIISFGPLGFFGELSPPIILIYRKGPGSAAEGRRRVRVVEVTDRRLDLEAAAAGIRADLERISTDRSYERARAGYRAYNRRPFEAEGVWYLATPKEEATVRALEESASAHVADVADIGVGPVSGANEAFALSPEEEATLPRGEKALVRHFVRAEHCRRWAVSGTAPYIFADEIADVETFERRYPVIYARLSRYRATLEARYLPNNRRWWDWATVRGLTASDGPTSAQGPRGRIFVPGIDRNPVSRYSFSAEPLVGLGDVLTISPRSSMGEDPRYLLAWLNSILVEEWYHIKGMRVGARMRYSQGQVSAIPYRPIDRTSPAEVKIHDEIVRLTGELLAGAQSERRVESERQINQLISRLLAPGSH